jgi:hypothetical protein
VRCLNALIERGCLVNDACFPAPIVLASYGGHADVTRLLLPWSSAANMDEAFGVAVVLGHEAVARLLKEQPNFAWTRDLVLLLTGPAGERAEQLMDRYPLQTGFLEEAVRSWFRKPLYLGETYERSWDLMLLLGRKRVLTRELVELALRISKPVWPGEAVVPVVRSFAPRASRVLPWRDEMAVEEGRGIVDRMLDQTGDFERRPAVLERVLGPAGDWDVCPYASTPASMWAHLVRNGVPVPWEKYADGAEFIPVLSRIWGLLDRTGGDSSVIGFCEAMKREALDISRHHFCSRPVGSRCDCGYSRCSGVADALLEAGASGCKSRAPYADLCDSAVYSDVG